MFEISLSFIFKCVFIVFNIPLNCLDSKYLLKAPTLPPFIDLRMKSLTYLSLKV